MAGVAETAQYESSIVGHDDMRRIVELAVDHAEIVQIGERGRDRRQPGGQTAGVDGGRGVPGAVAGVLEHERRYDRWRVGLALVDGGGRDDGDDVRMTAPSEHRPFVLQADAGWIVVTTFLSVKATVQEHVEHRHSMKVYEMNVIVHSRSVPHRADRRQHGSLYLHSPA